MAMTFDTNIAVTSTRTTTVPQITVTSPLILNGKKIFAGTSSTKASTATKVVSCSTFTAADLIAGTMLLVTFSVTNSATISNVQLNVNSTGPNPVKQFMNNGVADPFWTATLVAGIPLLFVFDGTNWVSLNSNPNYAVYQKNDTADSDHNVLFSKDEASTSAITNYASKSAYLKFNPSTKLLTVGGYVSTKGKNALYGEYSASSTPSSPVTGQLWLKQADMTIQEAKVLVVSVTASSLPTTITNSNITEDMEVIKSELSNPSNQLGDLTVSTTAGSATISGSISASTTIRLWLMRSR